MASVPIPSVDNEVHEHDTVAARVGNVRKEAAQYGYLETKIECGHIGIPVLLEAGGIHGADARLDLQRLGIIAQGDDRVLATGRLLVIERDERREEFARDIPGIHLKLHSR